MIPQTTKFPVGIRWGTTQVTNRAKDQVEVAEMLRKISTADGGRKEVWTLTPLISERVCNPDLAKAISDFQTFWRGKGEFRVVDGVVDPGGTTFKKMYILANRLPSFPDEPDAPVVPPSGVLPTPQDLASVLFQPPLFVGLCIKVSLADPLIIGTIGNVLKIAGIHIPHGCDLVVATMSSIGGLEVSKVRPLVGVMLGITPRRGAAKWTLAQTIDYARRAGLGAQGIKILEAIGDALGDQATSAAFGVGGGLVVAKGFASLNAMSGYRASAQDEASFNFAVGEDVKGIIKALALLATGANFALQSWSIIDIGRKLAADKTKAVAVFDIPGASLGVDVGVAAGTTTWHTIDVYNLVEKLLNLD